MENCVRSIPTAQARTKGHSLAIVEYDSAVGPAVMVHQAQVGEDAHAHCLEASLVTESETVAVDLARRQEKSKSTDTYPAQNITLRVKRVGKIEGPLLEIKESQNQAKSCESGKGTSKDGGRNGNPDRKETIGVG